MKLHVILFLYLFSCTIAIEQFPQKNENVRVFSNALPSSMFNELKDSLYDISKSFTKGSEFGTFWFPFPKEPQNIVDQTILHLRDQLVGVDDSWLGAEWWIQNRSLSRPLFFHFDADQVLSQTTSEPWVLADISSILYISGGSTTKGPTLILDQHPASTDWESSFEALVPPRANRGYLIYPQPNQYAMFRGNLLHGVLNPSVHSDAKDLPDENRVTLLVNFWRRHKPLAPACIEPQPVWYLLLSTWIMGTTQNLTNYESSSSSSSQLIPQFLHQSQLTNSHTLDLVVGQHSSVEIVVPLPENAQSPGPFVFFMNDLKFAQEDNFVTKPLLEMAMSVFNNAGTIAMSLHSVVSIIDHFTVVDRGSQDGSQEAAVDMLFGIPGKFYESEKDVMEAVNKTYAKYVLGMEAEWNMVHGNKLREHLLKNDGDSFYVRVHTPGQKEDFMSKCVYKNGIKSMDLKLKPFKIFQEEEVIPGVYFLINPPIPYKGPKFSEEDKEQWKLEIKVLEMQHKETPLDTRVIYDLAKRFHWLGKEKQSEEQFKLLNDLMNQ